MARVATPGRPSQLVQRSNRRLLQSSAQQPFRQLPADWGAAGVACVVYGTTRGRGGDGVWVGSDRGTGRGKGPSTGSGGAGLDGAGGRRLRSGGNDHRGLIGRRVAFAVRLVERGALRSGAVAAERLWRADERPPCVAGGRSWRPSREGVVRSGKVRAVASASAAGGADGVDRIVGAVGGAGLSSNWLTGKASMRWQAASSSSSSWRVELGLVSPGERGGGVVDIAGNLPGSIHAPARGRPASTRRGHGAAL